MKFRALKYALTACVVSIFLATSALSIEGASIVKLTSVDGRMTVYVKGAGEVSGVTAMLGRYAGRGRSTLKYAWNLQKLPFQCVFGLNLSPYRLFRFHSTVPEMEGERGRV